MTNLPEELIDMIEEKFEECRPKGFNSGECPRCSDLSIGFNMGAICIAQDLKALSKIPEVKALLKMNKDLFTDPDGDASFKGSDEDRAYFENALAPWSEHIEGEGE